MTTEKISYSPDSPYFSTEMSQEYLDILEFRNIPALANDVLHTLTQTHQYRPDLLAYDLYSNPSLWWVFSVRNPNTIKDPVWDFVSGIRLYLPKQETLTSVLGL
jgi:hypothetical protein